MIETPDGKQFDTEQRVKPAAAVLRVVSRVFMIGLKAVGKFCITTWRVAAALDSALWRLTKLLLSRLLVGLGYVSKLAVAAFRGLIAWLPTRTGRAYSAMMGALLLVLGLWMVDVLRAVPSLDVAGSSTIRPPTDDADPILARIEGRYVHLSEIEAAARAGGFLRPGEILTPQTAFARNLVESYVEQRLLARAALDDGMQRNPSVSRRVNAARDRVLAAAYMDAQVKKAVTPENVERLYATQADVTRIGEEVKARHIVVQTKEEAEEIVALLNAGADFAKLARERSIDRATAPLGGEVGWFNKSMMTPVFSNAAFAATPGEIAPLVETEFGWHILEVLDRRSTSAVPFTQVRGSIENFLRMRTIDSSLRVLEEKSQVVYFRPENTSQRNDAVPVLRDAAFELPDGNLKVDQDGTPDSDIE
ncbi:peptidylprolyl isomerase [Hyphococcus lacteus]|uniref:Parvulin-like PPIase n=1 Tax=Hyphococcus lacteus TaxID=3143536 RepID=A0ABV3Z3F8_9PROT